MLGSMAVAKPAEVTVISKGKEVSERDEEFVSGHVEDWNHGKADLYSLITYMPALNHMKAFGSAQLTRELHFEPRMSFAHMDSYTLVSAKAYYSGAISRELKRMSPEEAEPFRSDEHALPFSGLLHVPAFSFCTGGILALERKPALFCYHTHFEVGEITYMFGGLRCDPAASLKMMGIPKNTKLSQISIRLAQELPPYVDKGIFLSPSMANNFSFVTFNPTRGTVHEHPVSQMKEAGPSNICDMNGTRISETQVFFCGGFYVNIDSVTYKPELDRWIVEKSISMNTKGYILDTQKLSFSKVEIVAKLETVYHGHVGATLSSSYFQSCHPQNDSTSLSFGSEIKKHVTNSSIPDNSSINDAQRVINVVNAANVSNETSTNPLSRSNTKTPDNSQVSRSSTSSSTTKVSSARPANVTSPSAVNKKASLLSKSSRFFHRNLTKHSNNSNQSSVYSSYSNQVKQHRSKSLPVQTESRPSSPQYNQQKIPPIKLHIDTHQENHKFSDVNTLLSAPVNISSTLAENAMHEDKTGFRSPAMSLASEPDITFNTSTKSEVQSVCVYTFGGFYLVKDEITGGKKFVASNNLLKLELIIDETSLSQFHKEALMVRVAPTGDIIPLPRGFFAFFVADVDSSFESCELYPQGLHEDSDTESIRSAESSSEVLSSGQRSNAQHSKYCSGDVQLDGKRLVIHGGVNDDGQVFSDFFSYTFSTGTWERLSTYAFDYFNLPKAPYEDEMLEKMGYAAQVENAVPEEAELRCCHHRSMLYREDGKEHVIFCGGFSNDYLRHFDETPYTSDLLDVSRLARLLFSSTNSNLLRLPILNLSTQTWKFSRFFYDLREVMTSEAGQLLSQKSYMKNSRITFVGGAFLIVGKQLTFCHGLAVFVPEKAEEFKKMNEEHSSCSILLGGHFHLTFPGI
ncbi:hypothetical protein PUMCH_001336 [Australozyma saopauloensis]|uniref:Uncharacterized protein n=1 Tax=Australozyma saopauloensis TaxID=291208 RepID=A0AAX4H6E7_9ASCO|nr:hypothetical protein PUMCH_001336 [[Candida] saopauloensis]